MLQTPLFIYGLAAHGVHKVARESTDGEFFWVEFMMLAATLKDRAA